MSVNFNDSKYDSGSGVFNGGKAGIVNNCTYTVEKKTAEDKENSPEFKIIFTDPNGGTGNLPFWYITKPTENKTIEQLENAQGKMLKHLVHAVCGEDFKFPEFSNMQEGLKGCMKILKENSAGKTLRVFANFGSTMGIKKYPQPRTWVPVVESMSIPVENTRLEAGTIDAMEALSETPFISGNTTTAPISTDWDED